MFLLPLAGGILLALIQRLVYAVLLGRGLIPAERVPPFLVLFARGLVAVVVLAVGVAIAVRLLG